MLHQRDPISDAFYNKQGWKDEKMPTWGASSFLTRCVDRKKEEKEGAKRRENDGEKEE